MKNQVEWLPYSYRSGKGVRNQIEWLPYSYRSSKGVKNQAEWLSYSYRSSKGVRKFFKLMIVRKFVYCNKSNWCTSKRFT